MRLVGARHRIKRTPNATGTPRRDGSDRVSDFDGTCRFDDQGKLCINYPTLPASKKEFCTYMVLLGDGRYELTVGGIFEQILEGEQFDELN